MSWELLERKSQIQIQEPLRIQVTLHSCFIFQFLSRLFCRDVVFLDLGNSHFGSCVLDILQFVFTSIEKDIRTNFLADFVCSVYYDSFVKAVGCINNDLPVFSRRSLIKEFEKKIMYGFLLNLSIQSQMYEEGLQKVRIVFLYGQSIKQSTGSRDRTRPFLCSV